MLTRVVRAGSAVASRRSGRQRVDEGGLTLVELLVAMTVFSVVVVISGTMLRGMTGSAVRVSMGNDARTDVDRLYNRLDKQLPYAAAINAPVMSGGDWWLEFKTEVPAGGQPPRCWQYRLDTSERLLQVRSWPPLSPGSVTGWTSLVEQVQARAGAGAPPPFRMIPSSTDVVRQRLVVALDVVPVGSPVVPLDSTYVARNTTPNTTTNVAGIEVCREVART